ncbi:MAG TPA: hypothetical protein VGK33_13075 [Chloroflexota bacterium]
MDLSGMADGSSASAARAALDRFDVGGRLSYIRDLIWRGGALELEAAGSADGEVQDLWYALKAEWPAAVLERDEGPLGEGLVDWRSPVVEGRWVRGSSGYELRIGIDLRVPTAMYIRSHGRVHGFVSHVPFLSRPAEQVEHALNAELRTYVNAFLDHFQPVPQAAAADARRLGRMIG